MKKHAVGINLKIVLGVLVPILAVFAGLLTLVNVILSSQIEKLFALLLENRDFICLYNTELPRPSFLFRTALSLVFS